MQFWGSDQDLIRLRKPSLVIDLTFFFSLHVYGASRRVAYWFNLI